MRILYGFLVVISGVILQSILDEPVYFSLVYYFVNRPERAPEIIAACCEKSKELLGPVRPYLQWGLRRFEQRRRVIRYALDDAELHSGFSRHSEEGLNLLVSVPKSKRIMANDFVWQLDYQPDPISGVHFEPVLGLHFGLPYLTVGQLGRLRSFAEELTAAVVGIAEICHALADVGAVSLTGRGGLYHSQVPIYVPLDRLIRRCAWLRRGELRKRTLRGVFWGQVLSAWMVERLGGVNRFTSEYQALDDPIDKELVQVFSDGSVFVRLSNSPLDVRPPNPYSKPPVLGLLPPMIDRAVWLHERFSAAGLL